MSGVDTAKRRDSNLELYRILVMLLIIAHHYVVNSGITDSMYANPLSFQSVFLFLFGAWGKTGINCFMLITGYFMCKQHITAKKYAKLLLEVEIYRIAIYFIFQISGYESFSFTGLFKAVFPFSSVADSFTSAFLLFYLFIPFLNILIQNMTEKLHLRVVLLCLFIYTVLGTVPIVTVTMNYCSWFIVLYLIASYIRIYPKALFNNKYFWNAASLVCICISLLSVLFCVWFGAKTGRNMAFFFLSDANKIMAVATAVSSFMCFKNLKIKYSPAINVMGASTFGVLLIHTAGDAMRRWLWKDLLHVPQMYGSAWLLLHAVCSIVCIFVICTGIDWLRIHFIEKPVFRSLDKHWEVLSRWVCNTEHALCEKLHIKED